MQFRLAVFSIEQNCVYQDADGKDENCFHLTGWDNKNVVAYSRIVPAGVSYTEVSIGRVATAMSVRKTGAGWELMKRSIDKCVELFGKNSVKIGAQFYLKKFYESFGFIQTSEIYLEDGIEHIEMLLK